MNEEFDKIASAALDGEATEAELAAFDGDPEFQAAQTQLGMAAEMVAQGPVPAPPPDLAATQISLAMDHFRANAAQNAVKAAEPVSVAKESVRRSVGFPRWLAPAFFSIVVIAGVGFAAANLANTNSDDQAGDAFSIRESTATTAADSAEASNATMAAAEGELDTVEAADDAAMSDDSGAMVTPADIVVPPSPFVANRAMGPGDIDELTRDARTAANAEEYTRCGPEQGFEPPEGELTRVFAFTYDSEPAELLVYRSIDDSVIALIVGNGCEVLAHS